MSLEQRLQNLEDDRAIRDLKARYLRACDTKDTETIGDCLAADVTILFDGFPPIEGRDAFVEVYRQMGSGPGIFDIHHGANGIITIESETRASGQWSLFFHNINLEARTLTQMSVEYDDVYVKMDGRWWIAGMRTKRLSCLIHQVDDAGGATVSVMGAPPATFG
jgi:ketosteroid isomerase-like protein